MKARRLLVEGCFSPEELSLVYKAFDGAWQQIAPSVSKRAEAVESARTRLAEIILGLARNGTREAGRLTELGVSVMRREPIKLQR